MEFRIASPRRGRRWTAWPCAAPAVRRNDDNLLLFPQVGDRAQMAFILALAAHGVMAASSGIAVVVPRKYQPALQQILETLAAGPPPDARALGRMVPDMKRSKYDAYLGDDLLVFCCASERIDAARIPLIDRDLLTHQSVT
jgi:ATP-dependent helicase Lhr and Lhr-like helicase